MSQKSLLRGGMLLSLTVLVLTASIQAQQALQAVTREPSIAATTVGETGSAQASSTRVIPFSDALPGQPDGALTITFAIYPDQQSAAQLWSETQLVQVTGGKYTALLGSSSPQGVPFDLFAGDAAHWLGVQVNGSERRFLLVSVPYAMKAVEAERLGGLLPTDFVTVAQLATLLRNSAGAGPAALGQQPATGSGTFRAQAAAAGTPPQPATDFTDNNTSEVLLVTQQGTGYAIHAITSGQAEAILAQNDSIGGTALHAFATNATGAGIGVLAETASPNGIAGVFNNQTGGKILSLRNNGVEVASVDANGNVVASGQVQASNFVGSGAGLFNIPPSAVNATSINIANSVVARDGTGSFNANQIFASTFSGSGAGLFNIPPSAVNATPINIANSVVARDGTGSFNANEIFANTFSGSGAGLFNIPPSAVNATPINIASSVVARDGSGGFSAGFINASGLSATASQGPAIQGTGLMGIQASTEFGYGLLAGATSTNGVGTALLLTHASPSGGTLISGGQGTGVILQNETFNVDVAGNVSFNGGMMKPYAPSGTWVANSLVKLTNQGAATEAQVTMTSPGDTTGVLGIITGATSGHTKIQVAHSGEAFCNFDGIATTGDYVGISKTTAGDCADLGPNYPNDGQQIVGRVVSTVGLPRVLLFESELHNSAGGGITINTGAGLAGGPITTTGTISIANNGVSNAMLQNPSFFVLSGPGLSGGGPVPLGGTLALNNTGVLAFNGRTGNIVTASGDYSFSQISGAATAAQLPVNIAYTNKSNSFSTDQSIQGNMAVTGTFTTPKMAAGTGSFSGFATPANAVLSVTDNGNSSAAFSVNSVSTDPAAVFVAAGPNVLLAGPSTGATTILSTGGDLTLQGAVTARAFSGDGSALLNVSATKVGTLTQADIATNAALTAESTSRQSADTTLQNNINAESAARGSADAGLQAGIAAETSARQSDVSTLQTNINNVSAADAKLAASNTFTAGTQDFSGAGATLPVRAVLAANTPASCVAGKELLIKTDAPAGQQLFICNSAGDSWNLVGDGASGGVTAFNGRNGSVSPASGDYSFNQISGSAAASQLPATTVYNNQANTFTASQTVSGTVSANLFSGSGAGLSNVNAVTLDGIPSNAYAQLHAINTFTAEQVLSPSNAVNPSLNMPSGAAPATPLPGDIWNNGGVIQYRDNASTTRSVVTTTQNGGMQMLKVIGSIAPTSVSSQSCAEQTFSVSGVSTGDVLLAVLQPANSSPGTNIAIGGWRVSANNTVAIQFCNVSRNSSTPVAGAYTFAVMR